MPVPFANDFHVVSRAAGVRARSRSVRARSPSFAVSSRTPAAPVTQTEVSSDLELPWDRAVSRAPRRCLHLVLAWSLHEPERVGESFAIRDVASVGRGAKLDDDPAARARLERVRPGVTQPTAPMENARIPRLQWILEPVGDAALRVRSLGPATTRINGRACSEGVARAGDVLEIHNAAVFLVIERAPRMPELRNRVAWDFAFGGSDVFGVVGESEAAWAMRDALAFAAATDRHVLLIGESGVGKELAARAVHALSTRHRRALVARNATTMPEALVDAELFGNAKNYPNPGMSERPGLIGQADGSTLFLDEIGDLPEASQARLLRVLDSGGEYHRLGDAVAMRSSLRLVAATNRPLDALKHDLLARFTHRIAVPGLTERRDDIPLVVGELLRRIAAAQPQLAERFFEVRSGRLAEPRLEPALLVRLLRHPFTHHVRELERILWLALSSAHADYIGVTEAVDAELRDAAEASADATEISRESLLAAIAQYGRSPTQLAKQLGLKNRYVLLRLLKKHGLSQASEEGGTA
jgi:two-component system nitrogen regulation response regulator GlnG/two-component system response regulator HydG